MPNVTSNKSDMNIKLHACLLLILEVNDDICRLCCTELN
jgi:hypothetical protein